MSDGEEPQRPSVGAIGRMVFDAILAIVVAATGYYMTTIAQELRDLKASDDVIAPRQRLFESRSRARTCARTNTARTYPEIKTMLRDIQRDMQRKADRETIGPGIIRR